MHMKFIEDIEKDIESYTGILETGDISEAKKCVKQIEFVYGKRVDGLNGLYRNSVWDGDVDWIDLLKNAIRIIGFYKEEFEIKYNHDQKLGVNRINSSEREVALNTDISYGIQQVKETLEGTMSDQAYHTVLEKLDELMEISALNTSAGKKWIRIRSILEWSVTMGVDVYVMIAPIIYDVLTDKESQVSS